MNVQKLGPQMVQTLSKNVWLDSKIDIEAAGRLRQTVEL